MRLADVRHQQRAISILRRALRSGRGHHAYLFEGPEGVGKELTARALAARLLCHSTKLAADADACGQCASCRMLAADAHPDFHLIHRGLHKRHPDRAIRATRGLFLVTDLIRHFLIAPAARSASQGHGRVFVIRDAERMNEDAQNCLLKTLEEPPGQTRLILLTGSPARLLPTIRSRCQRIPFDLLPEDFVADELVRRTGLPGSAARTLAALSGGRLGAALRWKAIGLLDALTQIAALLGGGRLEAPEEFAKSLIELATALATRGAAPAVASTDEAADVEEVDEEQEEEETEQPAQPGRSAARTIPTDELRDALKLLFSLIAAVHRDALLARAGAPDLRVLSGAIAVNPRISAASAEETVHAAVHAVVDAEWMLDRNVAPQLVCERLAIAVSGGLAPA
jgi:DNA polymerase III delta' subunit